MWGDREVGLYNQERSQALQNRNNKPSNRHKLAKYRFDGEQRYEWQARERNFYQLILGFLEQKKKREHENKVNEVYF